MPSQDKLIKQGIKYTDKLFDEISKRLEQGVKASDTLESFLDKYNKAFPEKGNPLISLGYDAKMIELILQETNNHRFSRPSQKELTRVTIENTVGDLIVDVGDDIRESVRDIVRYGYDNNLSQDEIAKEITHRVASIKTKRARAIARTEIARTATISDYIINKERGATHFYVECRNTACPICKHAWHEGWTEEKDDSFKPSDSSAGGRGWIGDKYYPIGNTNDLPPIHPNCRCVAYFVNENDKGVKIVNEQPVTTTTTVQETEPANDSRISELEKQIADEEAMAEKWRKRGNQELANTFQGIADNLKSELEQLKNPNATKPNANAGLDEINNILNDVLNDIGLSDKAPAKVKTEPTKNIQTTHESNLWEKLGKKHNMELIEASDTKLVYHDQEYDTKIVFKIPQNKQWIDYTNSNSKARNMEDFLKFYNEAPSNLKRSSPTINIIGSARYDGVCNLSMDLFEINIARSGYQELSSQKGSGNLQHTMFHEMSHAHDMRLALDRTFAVMSHEWWGSGKQNKVYPKAITADRRIKKKTGGKTWVSEYVRTTNKRHEDYADLAGIVAFRDVPDKSQAYLLEHNKYGELVKVTYDELKERYPNRWAVLEKNIFGEYDGNW